MFNEVFFLQILILIIINLFLYITNLVIAWYVLGIFLILLGFFLLYDNFDIFIGFLWLIDLGVGLVFLIFIFHFSNFLYKKINLKLNIKILFYYFIFIAIFILLSYFFILLEKKTFYDLYILINFLISWYDYYLLFFHSFKTDLNLLREIYFFNNSLEFILINFFLLYGIISALTFFFIIKKIFLSLQLQNINYIINNKKKTSYIFIRNQSLLKQQDTRTSLKIWKKRKNDTKKNIS